MMPLRLKLQLLYRRLIILFLFCLKCNKITSQSCRDSEKTLAQVDTCPRNKPVWEERARAKNCSDFNQSCTEPEKFLYHCVINHFLNVTYEVCAMRSILFGGHCAEYNIRAGIIQENQLTDCTNFSQPCPSLPYKSTEAYKYPECYDLAKHDSATTQIVTQSPDSVSYEMTTQTTNKSDSDRDRSAETDKTEIKAGLIAGIVVLIIIVPLCLTLYILFKKQSRMKSSEAGNQDRMNVNGDDNITKEERKSLNHQELKPTQATTDDTHASDVQLTQDL